MDNRLNPIDAQVGAALHRLRVERGRSIAEVAVAMALDHVSLAAIEAGTGRASAECLIRASVYFGVPIAIFYQRPPHCY
jgi:transcriptional regulator with XRE-family HTH domain